MDHDASLRFSDLDGRGKSIRCQVNTCAGINRPADYPPGERVQHDTTEKLPFPRGMFPDVRHPKLIRSGAREFALDQVSDRDPWWGSLASTAIDRQASQASATHQQTHGVMSDSQPMTVDQLRMYQLPAERSSLFRMNRGDHINQPRVTDRTRGERP